MSAALSIKKFPLVVAIVAPSILIVSTVIPALAVIAPVNVAAPDCVSLSFSEPVALLLCSVNTKSPTPLEVLSAPADQP